MKNRPLVSVIIPTKNSESTIKKCLESIKNQTYPRLEVLIIDNFSTDSTQKIAENHGARIIRSNVKRSQARNIGAKRARGQYLFFIDSDMELDSHVIEACVQKIREGYDGIIIPEISVGEGFWAKCKAMEKLCYIGDEDIEAARFFKRKVFEVVDGYDIELEAGEDWDLSQRIKKAGFRLGRVCAIIKHHEGRLSLWKTIKKKYEYGKSIHRYMNKCPRKARDQLKLIRPAFRRKWRILIKEPIIFLGMSFMKLCEFVAGGIGIMSYKFRSSLVFLKNKRKNPNDYSNTQ